MAARVRNPHNPYNALERFTLDGENVWPRTIRERYGVFRVKDGGHPELMATCRTIGSIGVAMHKLGLEGEFENYCVGLMDGRDHKNDKGQWIGKWLILPWVEKKKGTA